MAARVRWPVALAVCALSAVLLVGSIGATTPAATQASNASADGFADCGTITEPGRYRLASDVDVADAGACLEVRASDVVVDGGNNAIVGNGTGGSVGVLVTPSDDNATLDNVTVRNLRVENWDTGIEYRGGVATGRIEGVVAANNSDGIAVDPGDQFEAAEDTIVLADNRAIDNDRWGIALQTDAAADRLVGNVARGNEFGLVLFEVDDVHVQDVRAADNVDGIYATDVSDSTFRNVTALANADEGITTTNDFDDNRLVHTAACGNGDDGIELGPASNTTLANATTAGNGGNGLSTLDTGTVTVETLVVARNGDYGLHLESTVGSTFGTVRAWDNDAGVVDTTDVRAVTVRNLTLGPPPGANVVDAGHCTQLPARDGP